MPEKVKSSTVTADEFLHDGFSLKGMQKSRTGSGSEAKATWVWNRVTNNKIFSSCDIFKICYGSRIGEKGY